MSGGHERLGLRLGEVRRHREHALADVATERLLGVAPQAAQQRDGERSRIELGGFVVAEAVGNFELRRAVSGLLHGEGTPR